MQAGALNLSTRTGFGGWKRWVTRPSLSLAVRAAVAVLALAATSGIGLAVAARHVPQPFLPGADTSWRPYVHGVTWVLGGGLFGDGHRSTGVFGWGTLLAIAGGYGASARALTRRRLPMLRDAVTTPMLAGLLVGGVGALIALVSRLGGAGPSPSRVFFVGGGLTAALVVAAFVTHSHTYHTFFWRTMRRVWRLFVPALRSGLWFFSLTGLGAGVLTAIAWATGLLGLSGSGESAAALALAGGNLVGALPLLGAGGTVTVAGDAFAPIALHRYTLLGWLGWPGAGIASGVTAACAVIAGIVLAKSRAGRPGGIARGIGTLVIWYVLAAVLLAWSGLRVNGEWAVHVSASVLGLVCVWAIAAEVVAFFFRDRVGPAPAPLSTHAFGPTPTVIDIEP